MKVWDALKSEDRSYLTVQMTVALLFLFLIFVILDVASTEWLIMNDPKSIAHEANPVGVLLYNTFGSAGLVFAKFTVFIIFAVMAVYFTMKYSAITWFVEVSQALVLCLTAASLVVAFNNMVAIIWVLYLKGLWPLLALPAWITYTILYLGNMALALIFANGLLYIWGLKRIDLHLKLILGLIIFLTPVAVFREGFKTYVWLFAVYVTSASTALGLAFYITESDKAVLKRA